MADVSRKKKRTIIILSGVAIFFLLFAASAEYTSHSRFCSACHYMKPFYQSWQESTHAGIECSVCHYPPGLRSFFRVKLEGLNQVFRCWTKLYLKSKPWAEIPDESCLRQGCHDKRLLQGKVRFNKIIFDHRVHLEDLKRGKKLRCTSCHSQIVQGEHITVTESSCFICHFKESEHYPGISRCSHCHSRESLVSEKDSRFNHAGVYENNFGCDKCHSQIILGDGAVPRENCYKCHFERDRLDRYGDTDLIHSTHIAAHKIECNQCHLEIQHKIIKDIETISDCRTCHTGFHEAQKILYSGQGGKGLAHPRPSIMLEKGLSCKGCHIFHEESEGRLIKNETLTAEEDACESCHGRGFARLLHNWQVATDKKLSQIKSVYEKVRRELSSSKGAERQKAGELVQEAAFNIDIVEKGKSVHNMAYSQDLLLAAFASLEEALRLAGSSYRPEPFLAVSTDMPGECSECHAGIEEIGTEIFGVQFAHKSHVVGQKMDCAACHSDARRHGEFISSKKACAACHHQEGEVSCGRCHGLQKILYEGGSLAGWEVPRDVMAEAGVACADCHELKKNRISPSGGSTCARCHEKGYEEILAGWQGSFKKLIASLRDSLQDKKNLSLKEDEKAPLGDIERTLRKLELDGSLGVHNSQFTEDLLTKLNQAVKLIGAPANHE